MHRNQGPVKAPLCNGPGSPLLTGEGKLVHRLSVDTFHGRNGIGADTLLGLGVHGAQVQVARIQHGRNAGFSYGGEIAHHLGAAGNHQIFHTGHDLGRGQADAGNARATVAVESYARRTYVIARIQGRHATKITGLLTALGRCPPDHVIDLCGLQVITLGKGLQHRGTKIRGVQVCQGTLAHLANATGCPAGVEYVGVGHGHLLECHLLKPARYAALSTGVKRHHSLRATTR